MSLLRRDSPVALDGHAENTIAAASMRLPAGNANRLIPIRLNSITMIHITPTAPAVYPCPCRAARLDAAQLQQLSARLAPQGFPSAARCPRAVRTTSTARPTLCRRGSRQPAEKCEMSHIDVDQSARCHLLLSSLIATHVWCYRGARRPAASRGGSHSARRSVT
jgi:hypothetical protein